MVSSSALTQPQGQLLAPPPLVAEFVVRITMKSSLLLPTSLGPDGNDTDTFVTMLSILISQHRKKINLRFI